LIDTIVAGNAQTGGDIAGYDAAFVVGSFNLIGSGGSGGIVGGTDGNIVLTGSAGPGLAPLGNNGGPNQTMALLPGSPAIGAGVALKVAPTDQRGDPLDTPPDIGAYQSQFGSGIVAPPATFVVTKTADDSSVGTLRWAVDQANSVQSTSTITFDLGSTPQTVTLAQVQLELSNPSYLITIDGPGSNLLTVSGNQASRVFEIDPMTTAAISGLTISGGSAPGAPTGSGYGGGLENKGILTLDDCTVSGNTAARDGGGLSNSGVATLNATTVGGNSALYGGGLFNDATLSLSGVTVSGNSAFSGGGIYSGRPSDGYSVSQFSDATLSLSGVTVSGNSAISGGGISNGGAATLTDCTVSGNTALDYDGGGINNSGTATLRSCTISDNAAASDGGGGLYNSELFGGSGTMMLTDCTVSGNSAGRGGGLEDNGIFGGAITLTDCTISGNAATGANGGGLLLYDIAATLTDCTISGNSAGEGGGLFVASRPATTLTDCTVSANTAGAGGGIYTLLPVDIGDTILAGNAGPSSSPDAEGSFNSQGNNLVGETDGSTGWVGSDLTGTVAQPLDPLLSPLGNYGGPTQTMALLPASPAIGNGAVADYPGTNTPITTDQRGEPLDSPPDIGAFQTQTGLVVNTTVDGAGSPPGDLSLRQSVNLADVLGVAETITFDPTVFATAQTITLTSGELELSNTGGPMTIIGPAAGLTISGGELSRVFLVDSGVTATLTGLTISGGSTTGNGGGLYNAGTVHLDDCTISGNTAASGGGIYTAPSGTTTLTDCTISGNSATAAGGGVYDAGGNLTLTDVTVAGNSAVDGGGLSVAQPSMSTGVFIQERGTVTIVNCTVSGNSAAQGGGLNDPTGSSSLGNTIVAGNTASSGGPDASGTFASQGNNLVGETDGSTGWVGSDLTGTVARPLNPLLSPLGSYGGPGQTMALLAGSPAIDAGSNSFSSLTVPSTDERGALRGTTGLNAGTVVDIGAFEASSSYLVTSAVDSVEVGALRTAVGWANLSTNANPANLANPAANTIVFDTAGAFATARTITLSPGLGTLELTGTGAAESVLGTAAGVTISGGDAVRVFQVDNGVTASLTGLTITGGSTTGNGGGLYDDGTLTLNSVTVAGNTAAAGGGLFIAAGAGTAATTGQVGITERGTTTIVNCTVTGNSAATGGALYTDATVDLSACTIANNTAATGGGIDNAADGSATLEDTIVAANVAPGGSPSDIGGSNAVGVAGTYDLVGTGGSGGLAGGTGNIILTSLVGLELAPLGHYGGPTPTIPLLPGSLAIGTGTVIPGISTDQRGEPLSASVDIGAFQSQGFTLTVVAGSTPQATITGTAFANPLAVTVTAIDPIEPVAGGVVNFTVNPAPNGASASLSAATATIGSDGSAQVTATANSVAGSFTVTASGIGPASTASFSLKNLVALSFSGIVPQTIPWGAPSATFSGTLADGTQAPQGEHVAVTLDGVTQQAAIGSSGSFSTTFDTSGLAISTTPYTVSFAYTSDGVFGDASTTSSLTVTKATPAITWADPAEITYGTAISAAQLDATTKVPGTLTYDVGPGTVLQAGGGQTLSVTFTPTDTTDYTNASVSVTIDVAQATPTIAWADPAGIVYGTALSSTQLDAKASWTVAGVKQAVAGSFTYSRAPGTILPAGSDQTLSVTFTPSDTTDYSTASDSVTIDVAQVAPAVDWLTPPDITYGTALSAIQLDATASVPGTFAYSPAPGTVLNAGRGQTLSVTFTPTDTADYSTASAFVKIAVDQALTTIAWAEPADIIYGTALSSTQLDATEVWTSAAGSPTVAGLFTYSPAPGTFLHAGSDQTLSVTFTPSDSADYSTASASVTINVARATPTLTVTDPGGEFDGNAFPASVTIAGPGAGDPPASSLEGIAPTLTYFDGAGTSGTSLGSAPPTAVGTYTVVAAFPGTADYSPIQSAPVTFTIAPATPTIALGESGGSAVYGQSVTLAATVAAAGDTPGGSVTFLDGTTPLATVPLDRTGKATLTVSGLAVGTHSFFAAYSGDTDDRGVQSGPMSVTVSRAATEIEVVSQSVLKKKKVVSLGLKAVIRPLAPGVGIPTGLVTFEVRSKVRKKVTEKVLGTAMLGDGAASLTVKFRGVPNQPITILYGGDAEFASSRATAMPGLSDP
jgi:parallel beta-helix repeat protein